MTPGSMTLESACITTTASCSSDQVAFWNRHNLGLFHHRDNDVEANQVTLVSSVRRSVEELRPGSTLSAVLPSPPVPAWRLPLLFRASLPQLEAASGNHRAAL